MAALTRKSSSIGQALVKPGPTRWPMPGHRRGLPTSGNMGHALANLHQHGSTFFNLEPCAWTTAGKRGRAAGLERHGIRARERHRNGRLLSAERCQRSAQSAVALCAERVPRPGARSPALRSCARLCPSEGQSRWAPVQRASDGVEVSRQAVTSDERRITHTWGEMRLKLRSRPPDVEPPRLQTIAWGSAVARRRPQRAVGHRPTWGP